MLLTRKLRHLVDGTSIRRGYVRLLFKPIQAHILLKFSKLVCYVIKTLLFCNTVSVIASTTGYPAMNQGSNSITSLDSTQKYFFVREQVSGCQFFYCYLNLGLTFNIALPYYKICLWFKITYQQHRHLTVFVKVTSSDAGSYTLLVSSSEFPDQRFIAFDVDVESSYNELLIPLIVVSCIAGLLLIFLIIFLVFYCIKKKKKSRFNSSLKFDYLVFVPFRLFLQIRRSKRRAVTMTTWEDSQM